MDETQDPKPHPVIHQGPMKSDAVAPEAKGESLSIWFFCGILTLGYGIVLVGTGLYERTGHQPNTVLAELQPTLWWGVCLLLFGLFYTIKFRPGKG